jgi:type IV pilus assembly protein PilW
MKRRVKLMHDLTALRAARSTRGFSLIELMIAMLLGLIVVAGVTSVFLANMSSYNANQGLSEVEDGARTAFELMSRDMRQAGLTGCNESESVVNVLNNGTTLWYADWNNASGNGGPLRGFEAGVDDPAVVSGSASGNRDSTYASLHMLGASASALSMSLDDQNAATFTLNETTATVPLGTIMIVCNPDHAAIVQITGQSGAVLTHAVGTTPSPGNCVKGLGMPNGCVGNQVNYQVNAMLAPLQSVDWYVGPNGTGTNSLWRLAPYPDSSTGNIITNKPSEIVRNVSDMQIKYLLSGSTSYVDATTVAGNWGNVTAIQVSLTLQSTNARAGVDAKPISRTFASTTTLRNRVN